MLIDFWFRSRRCYYLLEEVFYFISVIVLEEYRILFLKVGNIRCLIVEILEIIDVFFFLESR